MRERPRDSQPRRRLFAGAALGLLLTAASCATLQELAALRLVDFSLDRVDGVRIAGVAVDGRRDWSDLTTVEGARLAAAVLADDVPLDLVVHVRAENPSDNRVTARLLRMDWTLFLEDTETVSGALTTAHAFPPGQPVDVPIDVHLDLMDFFRSSARDAFELALALTGAGGAPKEVRLEALPTVETSAGPLRYPGRIVIRREVGGR